MARTSSAAAAVSLILLSLVTVGADAFLVNNKKGSQRFAKLLLSVFAEFHNVHSGVKSW